MIKESSVFENSATSLAARAKALSQKYFVSPEIFAKEQQRFLPRNGCWSGIRASSKKPGDFFLATIAGESLIVVRDQKSEIRAFYNVCRHRGSVA